MPAPTPIGGVTDTGVTLYYVPPPNQGPNVFTEFYAGFLKQRLPLAQQVFAQRLAQMSPADYSAEIQAYDEMEAEYRQRMVELQKTVMQGDNTAARAAIEGEYRLEQERMRQSGQSARQTQKLTEQRRATEGLLADEIPAEFRALEFMAGDELVPDEALLAQVQTAAAAAAAMPPAKRGEASRQLLATLERVAPGRDELVSGARAIVVDTLGAPGQGTSDEMVSGYGYQGRRGGVNPMLGGYQSAGVEGVTVPSIEDDPFLRHIQAQRAALQDQHGRTRAVDFNAPLYSTPDPNPFLQAFRTVLATPEPEFEKPPGRIVDGPDPAKAAARAAYGGGATPADPSARVETPARSGGSSFSVPADLQGLIGDPAVASEERDAVDDRNRLREANPRPNDMVTPDRGGLGGRVVHEAVEDPPPAAEIDPLTEYLQRLKRRKQDVHEDPSVYLQGLL